VTAASPALTAKQRFEAFAQAVDLWGKEGQSHCIGMEMGMRWALRHPEYVHALITALDAEGEMDSTQKGVTFGEAVMDFITARHPIEAAA